MDPQRLKLGLPVDADDEKFISGPSTVLIASIQEAKARISQIDFLFCSQLYPNFQSKSKALHKFYSDQWKEKESELLLQIEKMRLENQRVLEENRLLKAEEAKVNEPLKDLLAKQRRIEELEREIKIQREDIDEGMKLHKNLFDLVQTKASLIAEKDMNLKQTEEKTQHLICRVKILEEEVENLRDGLRRKNDELAEDLKVSGNVVC